MTSSIKTRRFFAAAAATALTIALAACSSNSPQPSASSDTPTIQNGGTVVFAIAGGNLENGHMDPHSSQLDVSAYVNRNVLDSLVALDSEGEVKPWLAKSWTISEDGLTYTFELRDDVTFHDGTAFDAAAAVANFEHIVADSTASTQAKDMLGGDLFASATATGDHQLTLTLKQPYAPLLTNLSTPFIGMYSPKVLAEKTQDEIKAGGPDVTVGSGPFKLTSYTPKQELVFEANKDYAWGPDIKTPTGNLSDGAPHVDGLTIKIVPEESARVGALTSGAAQVAVDLTPTGTAQLQGATINNVPSPGLPYSMMLNWEHGAFADAKVRKAFAIGFDLDSAVNAAFGGEFQRAWSVLSPTTPNSYDASLEGTWKFDAAAANALLDEAGWTERDAEGYRVKDGQRLSVEWLSWLPFASERQTLVNFMVDDLKKIGFELKHSAVEGPEYQARYADENGPILDFDATDWGFASLDADILRQHLHSQGYQNASRIADGDLDALLDKAALTTDPSKRAGLYKEVQQWNATNVGIIPLYLPQFSTASLSSVQGLTYDTFGWPLFAGVSLNK